MDETLGVVAGWLHTANRVLVFTGAGISTESGIPDFRGPNGIWRTSDPALATIQVYLADPEVRRARWRARLTSHIDDAVPNAGHRAIADLERLGRAEVVVTQNVDGLHQRAGSSRVIELHGTTREAKCLSCHDRMPIARVLSRVEEGDDDPACERCGGILKPATISFGQPLIEDDVERAMAEARRSDVCLAVGSTLSVWPAAGVALTSARAGHRLVILNDGATDLDDAAAAVVPGRAGTVLPRLVGAVRARMHEGH
ncbi:MAG TPA: NAD-dependent protein deacylase [Candidatus Dormibacteraeota bacterium]